MGMTIDEHLLYEMGYNKGFTDGLKGSIPKDQYEQRLKADLEAILVELQLEIEEKATELCDDGWWLTYNYLIQQKINALKENNENSNHI